MRDWRAWLPCRSLCGGCSIVLQTSAVNPAGGADLLSTAFQAVTNKASATIVGAYRAGVVVVPWANWAWVDGTSSSNIVCGGYGCNAWASGEPGGLVRLFHVCSSMQFLCFTLFETTLWLFPVLRVVYKRRFHEGCRWRAPRSIDKYVCVDRGWCTKVDMCCRDSSCTNERVF